MSKIILKLINFECKIIPFSFFQIILVSKYPIKICPFFYL